MFKPHYCYFMSIAFFGHKNIFWPFYSYFKKFRVGCTESATPGSWLGPGGRHPYFEQKIRNFRSEKRTAGQVNQNCPTHPLPTWLKVWICHWSGSGAWFQLPPLTLSSLKTKEIVFQQEHVLYMRVNWKVGQFRRKLAQDKTLFIIIIKFPYNARSDWLKQCTLSENKEQVNDINLAFKFFASEFRQIWPKLNSSCATQTTSI